MLPIAKKSADSDRAKKNRTLERLKGAASEIQIDSETVD
jgi:hypothetical protein